MATGNKRKFGDFRYPMARLESDSDYLQIQVLEYQPPGFETTEQQPLRLRTSSEAIKKNKETILGNVFLPIPESVTDSNGVTWGENSLNGLAAAGLGIAMGGITADSVGKAMNTMGEKTGTAINSLVSDKGSVSAINSIFASAAVNALGGNVEPGDILSRQSGAVLNPNMELLFGGVQLRTFSFDFDFAPRDREESEVIKKIIRSFKISMNAKQQSEGEGNGLFIKAPDVFQLTYKTGSDDHLFLHRFKPMAMLNMAVNYTGAGTYATYDNTSPVHMKLNLTFQELNPIYSEDYESEEGKGGTGF
tara:strand:+ start:203 stop:1117 length:915 start_codon:yes stop_codon:yes gene_type:complete